MLQSVISNRERQEDEVSALSNIYDCNEFSYDTKDTIKCYCNMFTNMFEPLEITNTYINEKFSSQSVFRKVVVEHLPPARLYLQLPNDYPSTNPPNFYLTISWLPPWETSFVCQKLDDMWMENKGDEIIFQWLEFLKNDLLSFLSIKNILDVSFMYMVYITPSDYITSNLIHFYDTRALNLALFLNPIKFLMDYNRNQSKVELERNYYTCCICLENCSGLKCTRLINCGHIYCTECIKQYLIIKIKEGTLKHISCPDSNCCIEMSVHEIHGLCPDLFSKYEESMLKVALNNMNDIVYCPRKRCQSPVIKDAEDTLATCTKCGYTFCSYCCKVYHGVAPCVMTSMETMDLIKDYQNGDRHKKKLLEKKYGRKQIQIIVEKHLTKTYLKDNAKVCPHCKTWVTKIDGCNKMTCIHCQASFCWLCGMHITVENAYDHFTAGNNECYGRLFEGTNEEALDDLDNIYVMEHILWFNEQHAGVD